MVWFRDSPVIAGREALLFQTGYLTITGEEELGGLALYRLGYPNREVRQSLNRVLLRHLVQDPAQQTMNSMRLARLRELFHAFFASIPYEWHTSNDIANYEGYYASVFYAYFAALGYEIVVEESSSHGRLDLAVRAGGQVYLFEFKVVELAPRGLRWRSCGSGTTRPSTAVGASRSTSSGCSSAATPAT